MRSIGKLLSILVTILAIASTLRGQEAAFGKLLSAAELRKEASFSAIVADLKTGKTIATYRPQVQVVPASVVKLFTTAAALHLLPEYPFVTDFRIEGTVEQGTLSGNLYIVGRGDPTLYSKYFPNDSLRFRESLLATLAAHGIERIEGSVVVEAGAFDQKGIHPLWEEQDRGDWYGNGTYGFNIFDNWIEITFETGKGATELRLTKTYPSNTSVKWNNRLRTTSKGAYAEGEGRELVNERMLKGTLPRNRKAFKLSIDLPHPPLYGASFITQLLHSHGIEVQGEGRAQFTDIDGKTLLIGQYYGPRLEEICRVCNVHSLNHYAEALLKAIALSADASKPASTRDGLEQCKTLWKDNGLSFSKGLRLVDGSGLSRSNSLSATDLSMLLKWMADGDSTLFQRYLYSLPEAGKEGSTRRFLKDTPYHAYLKSGTMRGLQAYAGYVEYDSRHYVVVFLCKEVRNRTAARQTIRKALELTIGLNNAKRKVKPKEGDKSDIVVRRKASSAPRQITPSKRCEVAEE